MSEDCPAPSSWIAYRPLLYVELVSKGWRYARTCFATVVIVHDAFLYSPPSHRLYYCVVASGARPHRFPSLLRTLLYSVIWFLIIDPGDAIADSLARDSRKSIVAPFEAHSCRSFRERSILSIMRQTMRLDVGLVTCLAAFSGLAEAFWRLPCRGRAGLARLDPLMDPGKDSYHVHAIHGPDSQFAKFTPCWPIILSDDRLLHDRRYGFPQG